ncbi:hypothetical protein EKO27_g6151 [Xylaria grammica]|uniref:Uncharacterized protein n=1 Tax=Xylaria grammica TaxID=363999 RepID=A0A439D3I8_9PEZI|nr:hypothetical protein EKO27_g6151 [Xylaria grammica]
MASEIVQSAKQLLRFAQTGHPYTKRIRESDLNSALLVTAIPESKAARDLTPYPIDADDASPMPRGRHRSVLSVGLTKRRFMPHTMAA